jgi:HD-like signal output (HDOD) protein
MPITDIARPATNAHATDSATDDVSPLRARLARILSGSDFPALSQQIIETISLLDDDASSLQRLANVVLREYSLTIAVVRTANSAHYRRTGKPIQSATHAMMMLGARTVRHLASSLLLFENYSKRSESLKELMLLSLVTANHARELAVRLGNVDPEEAHLCGMFRNFGEVLVAGHFPEDYAAIREAVIVRGIRESSIANELLGCRYEDLGEGLARHWGMPDCVTRSMRARASAPTSDVGAITALSHDLTAAIYRSAREKGDARAALDAVIEHHGSRLKLSRAMIIEVVEAALRETRELFVNANGTNGGALRRMSADARFALGVRVLNTGEYDAATTTALSDNALPVLQETLRHELEIKASLSSGSNLTQVFLVALEAALRGGPFDRVIACVLNPDRTRLSARSALGTGAEALMKAFDFPMTPRGGPLASALLLRLPLYLPTDRAMNAQEVRWAASMDCVQFGVFPILVATKVVGCLYVDRIDENHVPDASTLAYVRSLCDVVGNAIAVRRTARMEPAAALPTAPGENAVSVSWNASLARSLAEGRELNAESKGALILQLLQGGNVVELARTAGVAVTQLEQWRTEFLSGALARLA